MTSNSGWTSSRGRCSPTPWAAGTEAEAEIAQVARAGRKMKRVLVAGREGRIPLRVTHNDTKFNNVLFDRQGRGLCLIDLDTVMPGYVHYDFGDTMRSGGNRPARTRRSVTGCGWTWGFTASYARGFLHACAGRPERGRNSRAACFGATLLRLHDRPAFPDRSSGRRPYFKIARPGHNLQRARVQFRPAGRHGKALRRDGGYRPRPGRSGYFLMKTGWQKAISPFEENTLART